MCVGIVSMKEEFFNIMGWTNWLLLQFGEYFLWLIVFLNIGKLDKNLYGFF